MHDKASLHQVAQASQVMAGQPALPAAAPLAPAAPRVYVYTVPDPASPYANGAFAADCARFGVRYGIEEDRDGGHHRQRYVHGHDVPQEIIERYRSPDARRAHEAYVAARDILKDDIANAAFTLAGGRAPGGRIRPLFLANPDYEPEAHAAGRREIAAFAVRDPERFRRAVDLTRETMASLRKERLDCRSRGEDLDADLLRRYNAITRGLREGMKALRETAPATKDTTKDSAPRPTAAPRAGGDER